MMTAKAENMQSSNGNKVANQFEIYTQDGTYFQSYETIIAFKKRILHGFEVQLDKNAWNYSRTTSKYRSIFLNESTKETEAKIKSGVYKLVDLNN